MSVTSTRGVNRAPNPSGLYDVLDLILDKGLVIDIYVRVSLVGIELLTIDARIVVASVDTYLRFAEAVNRLDLEERAIRRACRICSATPSRTARSTRRRARSRARRTRCRACSRATTTRRTRPTLSTTRMAPTRTRREQTRTRTTSRRSAVRAAAVSPRTGVAAGQQPEAGSEA